MSTKAMRTYRFQLKHPDAATRATAALGLGRYGPAAADAAAALGELLADGNECVRAAAADALGRLGVAGQAAISELTQRLNDDSPAVRRAVMRALRRIGPAGVPPLVDALCYGAASERAAAAIALRYFGTDAQAAVPALTRALHDAEANVRTAVARALVRTGADLSTQIPTLVQVLAQEPLSSRAALAVALAPAIGAAAVPLVEAVLTTGPTPLHALAIRALGFLGTHATTTFPRLRSLLADANSPLRSAALQALARLGPVAAPLVPDLLAGLPAAGDKIRERIVTVLARVGRAVAPAVPHLVTLLASAYGVTRERILRALSHSDTDAARLAIVPLLTDATPAVRAAATTALGRLGGPVDALVQRLEDPTAIVRTAALHALRRARASVPVPTVTALLDDRSADVRRAAAQLLGQRTKVPKTTLKPWATLLQSSPFVELQRIAAEVHWRLTQLPITSTTVWQAALHDADPRVRAATLTTVAAAARANANVIPTLVSALANPEEPLGQPAARALTALGKKALPALVAASTDARAAVRAGAVLVLARLDSVPADAVFRAADDLDAEVRTAAAQALGRLPHADSVAKLGQMLTDEADNVRAWAALALAQHGPAGVKVLPELLRDRRSEVRAAACAAVAYCGPDALPVLSALGPCLRDADATVRRRAEQGLAALARLVQPTWQPVLDFLASSEPAYRQWAAVRLAAAGAVAVPLLIPALAKNRPVEERLAALDALRRLGPLAGAAAPIVLDCLDDDEADVRKLVPGALAAFGGAAVPVLTAALRRPKPLVRHGALVALAQCRAADAGPALVAHLVATPEVVEQHLAAEALAGCGPAGLAALQHALGQHPVRCLTALAQMPEVPAALLAPHLHAPTAPVRLAAVLAVGRTQRTELAPNVLACLDDEEPVADVAALALAQLDAPTVAAELAQRVQTAATAPARRRAVAALGTGANARQHVAALLAVATDADVQVRRQTLSTLASLAATQAEAVYAVLLAALDDADGLVRTHAINGLAGLGTRGEPALRTALHKPDARLRRTAWPALLALQPGDADELLNSALTGRDCALACAALTALGQRRERLAVTTVNAAVASPLRDLRQTALATLHVWDATGNLAGAGLVEAFAAADPRVRLWALQAAEQVPPLALVEAVPVLTLLGGDWGTAANQAQKLLRKIGPAALPGFRSVLTSKEAKVRNRGLDTLRQFNWSAWYDLNHHAKHLHNPPADVTKKLDRVLKNLFPASEEPDVGKLTRLLKHKSDHQRREAARQLGDLGHAAAKAVSALLKALAEDADADVRTRSAETLGKIGVATPAVVTALTAKLTDSKPALKLAAATALARLRQLSPTALELLLPELNLNKTGPETARELIALLGPCGASAAGATTALVPLTTHADVQLRTWTVWALGQIGTGGAALLTALHDPHPRVAAWALGAAFRVARTEFDPLPCLERLVPCPQVEVARALADAVELIGPAATELLARLAALDDPTFRTASELIRQQTGPFAPALKLEDEESLSDDDDDDDDDYDSDMDDMDSDY